MNSRIHVTAALACALLAHSGLRAEEDTESPPPIAGLEAAAEAFIVAFNERDAAAVAALFTEDGEMTDLRADEVTSGRAEIEAHYAEIFAEEVVPSVALEVDSVRLVADNLAIEDGTIHFTPPGENSPARSSHYTAALLRDDSGEWKIASTRSLTDATEPAGQLAGLAEELKGDWTAQREGMRMDFAFGWDSTGKYLAGELLVTSADAEPQTTSIRFGWDGARKIICCWTFDDKGGFAKADWAPTDDGWTIRTHGTTASGEAMSASQQLTFEDEDVMIWTAKERLVDGEIVPDTSLRIVRQAPEPAL